MAKEERDDLVRKLQEKGFIPTNDKEDTVEVFEIAMPRHMFTDKALDNLRKVVKAKGDLIISKALETVDLSIIETDEEVRFPWYKNTEDADEINYYLQFTQALCKMAIKQTRVTSTAKRTTSVRGSCLRWHWWSSSRSTGTGRNWKSCWGRSSGTLGRHVFAVSTVSVVRLFCLQTQEKKVNSSIETTSNVV